MLEDARGVASTGLGLENENDIEEDMCEQPIGEAAMFHYLLKEHQEPLMPNGETISKLSYVVKLLHLEVITNWTNFLILIAYSSYNTNLGELRSLIHIMRLRSLLWTWGLSV